MTAFSDYMENKLADFVFRGFTFTPATTYYLALFTTTDNDANSSGVEVVGSVGYSRFAISTTPTSSTGFSSTNAASTTAASTGTNGTIQNNGAIAVGTATGSWGTVTSIGLFDASTAGNLIFWGPLTSNATINAGVVVSFAAGTLTFQIDS